MPVSWNTLTNAFPPGDGWKIGFFLISLSSVKATRKAKIVRKSGLNAIIVGADPGEDRNQTENVHGIGDYVGTRYLLSSQKRSRILLRSEVCTIYLLNRVGYSFRIVDCTFATREL
eukprot:gb/GECG01014698.1/.p1 GENE.gb/GECG01014698.1/~~gb/GECG01014698.1/.p1  ORF type:complete len:116 (+),score=10.53 gb/GECG01014698.1/:1-348(+)